LTTLPIFLATFALHVQETARSGLAQLPVLAEWQPGDYPRVGGYRLETNSSGSGLEMGDRLIRLGDRDLQGGGLDRERGDRPGPHRGDPPGGLAGPAQAGTTGSAAVRALGRLQARPDGLNGPVDSALLGNLRRFSL
jgi:hypothetical protein